MKLFYLVAAFVLPMLFATEVRGQSENQQYTIVLTGASFASPTNTWFETGCERIGANPINRAVGGQSILSTVKMMLDGTLYSREELEKMDALVIMQVHEKDVYVSEELGQGKSWQECASCVETGDYAVGFDFVIKRYLSDCYELRNDPESKYYGTPSGKPAMIVLCTHWHDARSVYNESVRKLAAKWGLPLVEFDSNIGFSSRTTHPVTGENMSLIYADDTQEMNGVRVGWHPLRGKEQYIQQKMAAIFADRMLQLLP